MTKDEIKAQIKKHGSVAAAARALGVARTTLRERIERLGVEAPKVEAKAPVAEPISIPAELLALRKENAKLKRDAVTYVVSHGNLEGIINQIVEQIPPVAPAPSVFDASEKLDKPVVDACLQISDIHYGAVQPADEVEGFGEFSPDICEARMANLFTDFLDFIERQRHGYDIRNLHILCTGDYISGDIQDLRVTNAFPAPVQTVRCGMMLASLIAGASCFFESVHVHVVTDDNHGRLTKKPQSREGGLNNYSYVVAEWIKQSLVEYTNITVNVIPRPWESVECNGRRYLLTHGHRVVTWAGFPYAGIERIASREAMKRMNAPDIRKFHKIVMGHWHTPLKHQTYFIGGSVSGTDAYDHGAGRDSRPQQTSWMIGTHGEFSFTEWNLWD